MLPIRAKSTLPPTQWARPAAHSRIAAWKTSVPTTRCGVRRKTQDQREADQRAEPTEVRPRTKPSTSADADGADLRARASARPCRARAATARHEQRAGEDRRAATTSSATATTREQRRRRSRRRSGRAGARAASTPSERARHAADGQPLRHAEVDGALAQVAPAADGLRDRAVGEVGADRDDRLDADERGSAAASSASRRRCRSARRARRRRGRRR